MRGLIWFREDLRIDDNTALFHAVKECTDGVLGLYIIDPTLIAAHHVAVSRQDFTQRGLSVLRSDLAALNIPLKIITLSNNETTAALLLQLATQAKIATVFFNRQYEINESRRDQAVINTLGQHAIRVKSYDDQTILPPTAIVTKQGSPYKVFTAYKHAWYDYFRQHPVQLLPRPHAGPLLDVPEIAVPDSLPSQHASAFSSHWPAGELAAKKRLADFVRHHLAHYDKTRDFPALSGTSQLSPYLASGMISPRRCFLHALHANQGELASGNSGAVTWMSELIWREFYKSILITTPRVSMHKPYLLETDNIRWRSDENQLRAWQRGETGIPIVDAAMRQLNTLGWMHNRLRMVTAMFFSKNLFLDWRLGEDYFMRHLIDGDLAANNGGWQWCASTGTDAAPYFRIFNPIRQSERFDPDGTFIRTYCPELRNHDARRIHLPSTHAIVDLDQSRKHAIAAFKKVLTKRSPDV